MDPDSNVTSNINAVIMKNLTREIWTLTSRISAMELFNNQSDPSLVQIVKETETKFNRTIAEKMKLISNYVINLVKNSNSPVPSNNTISISKQSSIQSFYEDMEKIKMLIKLFNQSK
jgi:hypothetical protein